MGLQELLDRARFTETPDDTTPLDVAVPDDASAIDDILPPDPKPGKAKRSRAPRPPRPMPTKATAAQKRQVEDAIEMMLSLLGGGLSFRDQVCGPAITEQAKAVAKAASPIICRNPAWLAWFVGGTGFLDAMALLTACWPIGSTIWAHHVTGSLGHDHDGEDGRVDYTAYPAPSL